MSLRSKWNRDTKPNSQEWEGQSPFYVIVAFPRKQRGYKDRMWCQGNVGSKLYRPIEATEIL